MSKLLNYEMKFEYYYELYWVVDWVWLLIVVHGWIIDSGCTALLRD